MSHKYILDFFIVITLFIMQSSLVSAFHFGLEFLLPVILLILFYLLLVSFKRAIFIGIVGGFCLGAYSSFMQGTELIAIFVMITIVWLLFSSVFTNRSVFSLSALVGIGIFIYDLTLWSIDLFYQLIFSEYISAYFLPFIQVISTHILINTFIIFLLFCLLRSIDVRFNTLRLNNHG